MNKSIMDVTCQNNHQTKGVIDGTFNASKTYTANCPECEAAITVKGGVGQLITDSEVPVNSVVLTELT